MLTYETIRELRHSLDKTDALYPKVNALWMAMTDWVAQAPNLETFIKTLHQEVKNDLTKANLQGYLKVCSGEHWAWKGETVLNLISLFAHYPDVEILEELFVLFEEEVRAKI